MDQSAFDGYVLITGGAGFIGTNLATRLLESGRKVVLLDDFSRRGVEHNARFLADLAPGRATVVRGDCRNAPLVAELVRNASAVYHLAAQVAVTTSLHDPIHDFDVNVGGTLNVLEAVRAAPRRPPVVFTSTNKVYGDLAAVPLRVVNNRYEPADEELARSGIDERTPLDFHSPYGCSKGAADQYVLDYARSYGLRTVVFRMSCIYGPHQCGNEDQGWVAHFLICALARQPITVYGDGRQVRDVLYVGDLVDALLAAGERIDELAGRAFNIGGGPRNAVSLLEVLERIGKLVGVRPELAFAPTRTGDQRYFVTNTGAFQRATGWAPRVAVDAGLARLHGWLKRGAPGNGKERDATVDPARAATLPSSAIEGP